MNRLHGGDHGHLTEAWDVVWVEVLCVLYAPAKTCLLRIRVERALVNVQRLAIRPVADGVGVELKSVLDGETRRLLDALDGTRVEARTRGKVLVRLQQPSAV